jgi:hypothetical protein
MFSSAMHQVDHVIAVKHGGTTRLDNLALSCVLCNLRKGSNIASLDPDSKLLTPLFNPRTDSWVNHFQIDGISIVGTSPEGRVTIELLGLNTFERRLEREAILALGIFDDLIKTRRPK